MTHLCSCLLKLISCRVTFVVHAVGRGSVAEIGLLPSADGRAPLHSTYPVSFVSHSRGLDPHYTLSESHLAPSLLLPVLHSFNSHPIPHSAPPLRAAISYTSSVIHSFRRRHGKHVDALVCFLIRVLSCNLVRQCILVFQVFRGVG